MEKYGSVLGRYGIEGLKPSRSVVGYVLFTVCAYAIFLSLFLSDDFAARYIEKKVKIVEAATGLEVQNVDVSLLPLKIELSGVSLKNSNIQGGRAPLGPILLEPRLFQLLLGRLSMSLEMPLCGGKVYGTLTSGPFFSKATLEQSITLQKLKWSEIPLKVFRSFSLEGTVSGKVEGFININNLADSTGNFVFSSNNLSGQNVVFKARFTDHLARIAGTYKGTVNTIAEAWIKGEGFSFAMQGSLELEKTLLQSTMKTHFTFAPDPLLVNRGAFSPQQQKQISRAAQLEGDFVGKLQTLSPRW